MRFHKTSYLLLIAFFAFIGCNNKNEAPQSQTIKYVKVETISNGNSQNKMVFNGKIKEKNLTSLSFRVGGPLAKLNVKPGDYVRAGQVIATIDKRDYEIQVQTNKAQFEQIEGEYKRYKQLVEKDKIPENTFEKIKSGYLMAKSGYDNAQNQLRDTELKAPFSGYIHEKFTENFQTVKSGQSIVSIIDLSQLEVVVGISENQLQKVRNNNTSVLDVKNAGVGNLPVKLESVGEKTKKDGLYEVKFSFKNNKDLNIAPGMTAKISMYCDKHDSITTIASSAVFHEKTSDYVWVFNPSTQIIKKREIEISVLKSDAKIEIISGLNIGDQVVTAGVHYLYEGQKVRPIEQTSETNIGGLL